MTKEKIALIIFATVLTAVIYTWVVYRISYDAGYYAERAHIVIFDNCKDDQAHIDWWKRNDNICEVEEPDTGWWSRTDFIRQSHLDLLRCTTHYWRLHYDRGTKPEDLPPIRCNVR